MSKMTAYDFAPTPEKVGDFIITGATLKTGGNPVAERLQQFAQDVKEGKVRVLTVEVKSLAEPSAIVNTVLTITFTELHEADK